MAEQQEKRREEKRRKAAGTNNPYISQQKIPAMGYMQEARENHVKKKVEEALRSKMKQKALKECDEYTSKYAQCAAGKTLSIVWQCRKQAKELNDCLHQFTNDAVLEEMKKEYMLQENHRGSARV